MIRTPQRRHQRETKLKAKAVPDPRPALLSALTASALVLGCAFAAFAEGEEVITATSFSNFGETKYPEGFAHVDFVNPDAPKGGEISISAIGNFDSFNPYARKGRAEARGSIGSEGLVAALPDDPYGLYCLICETMEYPESLDWVIFNLRDDVTFADGTPATAEDVAFSFNLFLEQGITEYRRIVEGFIENVEVLDPQKIKFTFTETAPKRERMGFAGGTPVFSKAWFEATGTRLDESTEEPFMSTGAYVLESKEFNRQAIYKRNPNYWGAEHPLSVGMNNFDRIRVEYFGDTQAAFEGFKGGAFNFRVEGTSKLWATGYDFQGVVNGDVIKATFEDNEPKVANNFVFNLDHPEWQDKRVRQALGYLMNFEWSNEALFYDLYARVESFWPASDLAASGVPSEGEIAILKPLVEQGLFDESILTDEAVVPPANNAKENRPDRRTLRKASALLDEAGWIVGEDGMRRKDGKTLDATFLTYAPSYDRIINPIIENMRGMGINAVLDRVDTSQYIERRRKGDFELTVHSFDMPLEPGIGMNQWFASWTADDSSRNVMRLRNPGIDEVIKPVIAAATLDELKTAVHALDRVLRAEYIGIPQWYKPDYWVAYFDMFGNPGSIASVASGYPDTWWYDAEKHEALKASGALR